VGIEQAKTVGDRLVIVFGGEPPGRSAGEEFREHHRISEQMGSGFLAEAAREAGRSE
jgi:hypothetical protein